MTRGLQAAATTALDLWDRLAASDPGLERLALAGRGTLSVFLTTLAAMLATRLAGFSIIDFASGITLSLMAPFLMREPTRRQRQRSLLILPLPAAAATVATTLLQGQGPVGDTCFLALVFVCFLFHPRNPRMIGVGLIAVVETYVGLYLDLPLSALPMQLLSLVMAVPVIAFACFVVLPMNPAATLRRTIAAVQGRAAQVLRTARAITDPRAVPDAMAAHLWRDLIRLNEAALAADDQVALLQPAGGEAVRAALIDLELAAARLARTLGDAAPGPRHAARLVLHEQRMRRGRRYAMLPGRLPPGTMLASLVDLGHAVHGLGAAMQSIRPAAAAAPVTGQPAGPLAWRLASRVTLAAALAMAAGMALSPQRWFWAVLTVYVVFLNARSSGDTIYKGLQRLGGTVLGIASGLALAMLLAGNAGLQAAALLLSIFGMYYWFLTSYTAGIFCVTVMLGLLYGMLGTPLETLLVLRAEETAIGAAAAMLVAAFVLPIHTADQVLRSGQGALASLVAAVQAIRQALTGCADAAPLDAMRRVDRQMADLRLALAPLTAGRLLFRRSAPEGSAPALLECVHWTRVMAACCSRRVGGGRSAAPADARLISRAEVIETRLAKLATAGLARTGSNQPDAARAGQRLPRVGEDALETAMDMLEISVATLTEQMEHKALASFALGSP